jgi:hypothetical protein
MSRINIRAQERAHKHRPLRPTQSTPKYTETSPRGFPNRWSPPAPLPQLKCKQGVFSVHHTPLRGSSTCRALPLPQTQAGSVLNTPHPSKRVLDMLHPSLTPNMTQRGFPNALHPSPASNMSRERSQCTTHLQEGSQHAVPFPCLKHKTEGIVN